MQHSDDDGLTWSAPREITAQVKRPGWRWYATTPGHALQLTTGRVLVPANHTVAPAGTDTGAEAKYHGGHCLLSDDRGATWRLGYLDDDTDGYVNVNETTAAELPRRPRLPQRPQRLPVARQPRRRPLAGRRRDASRSPSARRPD